MLKNIGAKLLEPKIVFKQKISVMFLILDCPTGRLYGLRDMPSGPTN